jgi:parallel beta-helix repeat protein
MLCLALLLLGLLTSSAAAQTTIRVPTDQPTIQAGIGAALPGDTVLVAPGTYAERITYSGKAITVASEMGPVFTIIDGGGAGVVVTFNAGETRSAVLRGFTVTNGGGFSGGGVAVSNASPTIEGNIITGNTGCDGVGITVSFGSPLIVGNQITSNVRTGCSGGVGGAGVKVVGAASTVIEENLIADNWLADGNGGGISLFAAGTPVVRNNVIARNTASGQGGGIWLANRSDALIVQNLIFANSAGEGGGVHWLVPSGARGPRLVNNTIADNYATMAGRGAAVFADGFDGNAIVANNLLIGPPGQTALHCGNFNDTRSPVVQFNDVFTPGGDAYGGICADQTGVNGNISVDPVFVAPGAYDYRLQPASSAIDAGNSLVPDVPGVDLDGNLRVADGKRDGVAVVDMGAHERPSGPINLPAAADSMLTPTSRNLNDGTNAILVVDTHRIVVSFDLSNLAVANFGRATLQLTLAEAVSNWGGKGRLVSVHRLAVPFAEGNGRWFDVPSGNGTRGFGPGVTWNCAADSEIANTAAECPTAWNGGSSVAGSASSSALHTSGLTGAVQWDVTADVRQALSERVTSIQWLIRRAVESQNGRAVYHSKDGAALLGNLELAPTLTFE